MPVASTDPFPEAAPDTLLESNKPSLSSLAQQHLPIVVPWHPGQTIFPGTFFYSSRAAAPDPWSTASAFLTQEQESAGETRRKRRVVYLSADGGTSGSFKSTTTQSTTSKQDHESYGFTATVDLGFAKASGSLEYDRHLSNNNDDIKTSFRASYRCGTVLLRDPPELTLEAQRILKYDGGIDAFERTYGDYYLFGYNLGADNAMMVSTNSKSMSLEERKTLTVKVESFFFDINFTEHFDSAEASASASLRCTGYDTLESTNMDREQSWAASSSTEFAKMQAEMQRMRTLGACLPSRVEHKTKDLGLFLGPQSLIESRLKDDVLAKSNNSPYAPLGTLEREVTADTCDRLIKSGLVVELVLMPVRSLRQVRYWMTEDDII